MALRACGGDHAGLGGANGPGGYFLAPVTVAGRYGALAFQAVEPGERAYPPDQIELLCAELGLDDGDLIAVWLNDG